ncbi:TraM recognition domain-containing protein [Burkholderia pseudomallei]|uniref:TraM recognition domain-containing protein n=1 Tax=Burkholderia pseudomallei TaxID=28450 RepID=UPI0009766C76|nr:TraM recognition domain-containing protein [Burkholderia pseudomallei]
MSLPIATGIQSAQSAVFATVEHALSLAGPWYWIVLAIPLFVVSVLHPVPWRLPTNDPTFRDWLTFLGRRVSVIALYVWVLFVPALAFFLYVATAGSAFGPTAASFGTWAGAQLGRYWPIVVGAIVYGAVLRFVWDRYVTPKLSRYLRALRVKQEIDKMVDARDEIVNLKAKSFEPEKYFVEGRIFYGLDENDQPIYFDLTEFQTTHHLVLGPSDFGKGIILQPVFKQVIRIGFGVVYVDPKGDSWLPYLLQNEAKAAGRRFVYLDLRPDGKGSWHPFMGGSARERRTRITRAFNLDKAGDNSDVYKAKERALLDDALESTDGSIKALSAYVNERADGELSMLRDSLREWSRISTFAQPGKRKGHSIERCLMENAVVYVRGDLRDPVVKEATKAYIAELTGEIARLAEVRPAHVVFATDELKFIACAELNEAIATIRQHRCNMFLLGQSIANVEAPDDKRLDGKALAQEIEVNTPIKFVYRAADARTAEWAETMSAKQYLSILQREVTKTNVHGGEVWEGQRTIGTQEAPIISQTTLLNLPRRVGIAFMPGRLATKIFTSPTKIDNSYASWKDQPAAPAAPAAPAESTESTE